jgi:hypothetical protein
MEGFMEDIFSKEVSLVKRPANRREFILTKAEETIMEELLQVVMETEASNEEDLVEALKSQGVEGKSLEATKAIARLFSAYQDDIDAEAFKTVAKALDFELESETNPDEDGKTQELSKSDLVDIKPELRGKITALLEKQEAMGDRVETLEEALEKAADRELHEQFVTKTEGLDHIPVEQDKLASILKSVHESAGEEASTTLLEALRSVQETAEESGVFEEIGSAQGDGNNDAWGQIEKKAAAMVEKSDGELSRQKAISRAIEQNPDLYRQYREGS